MLVSARRRATARHADRRAGKRRRRQLNGALTGEDGGDRVGHAEPLLLYRFSLYRYSNGLTPRRQAAGDTGGAALRQRATEQPGVGGDVRGVAREARRVQRLGAVAEGVRRVLVALDDDPVGAHRGGGPRQRRDQPAIARRVA